MSWEEFLSAGSSVLGLGDVQGYTAPKKRRAHKKKSKGVGRSRGYRIPKSMLDMMVMKAMMRVFE